MRQFIIAVLGEGDYEIRCPQCGGACPLELNHHGFQHRGPGDALKAWLLEHYPHGATDTDQEAALNALRDEMETDPDLRF